MRARCLIFAAALLLALQGCGRRGATSGEPFVRSAVSLLRSNTVTGLEVLYYSRSAEFFASVTPDRLERIYQHRLSVENLDGSGWKDDLIRAMEDPDVERATGGSNPPDCRWACIFYNAEHARVITMYFDGYGRKGMINGIVVVPRGGTSKLRLVTLLEDRCLPTWGE